jgi:hypothetical protein
MEGLVKSLVDAPEAVSVEQVEGDVLELTVAPNEVGKVIGRQGRTARALRTLLNAAGVRANKRYRLEIIE